MGKRGPTCSICDDQRIEEINKQIIDNQKLSEISRKYRVSDDALERHSKRCVIKSLAASPSTQDIINGDNLLEQLKEAREKALSLLDMAIAAGDTKAYGAPSNYLREIREQIKLWAELEGRLATQPQINILVNPQWVELRTLIIKALEPYPEVREAVIHAIRE
jgi:hypothetical protein